MVPLPAQGAYNVFALVQVCFLATVMSKVVCSGYLTKNPTSGGRGRWRLRWVELVDSRNKGGGNLRVEYSISEKKRKNPLGESDGACCSVVGLVYLNHTTCQGTQF